LSVLASRKTAHTSSKGKGADLEKWDAEVRSSLANKKAPSLSKQDQALVSEQLKKESAIRKRIFQIRSRLLRGLQIVKYLVAGNIREFVAYVSLTAELLVEGGALNLGARLVGQIGFETYIVRLPLCHERGGSTRAGSI